MVTGKVDLTSGDVHTLHGQHPVIVACIVEPVLHHCIVGKLLQDFNGLVLSPGLVECCAGRESERSGD